MHKRLFNTNINRDYFTTVMFERHLIELFMQGSSIINLNCLRRDFIIQFSFIFNMYQVIQIHGNPGNFGNYPIPRIGWFPILGGLRSKASTSRFYGPVIGCGDFVLYFINGTCIYI